MKTYRNIIALVTILMPIVAGANIYEDRIKEALENITQNANSSSLGLTYCAHDDPETGQKDGELHIVKFKLGPREAHLIEQAKAVYHLINEESKKEQVPYLYTMWWNTTNDKIPYSGVRLYYSPENSILVGNDTENSYTVGFFLSENTDYRNTYTLEWSNTSGDSVKGRVITTFGPIASKAHSKTVSTTGTWSLDGYDFDTDEFNAQMEKLQDGMARFNEGMERLKTSSGSIVVTTSSDTRSSSGWMKKMLFYLDKIQRDGNDSRYIYLSKLYDLCKNTDCLDQQDLKIALQQVSTCYKKLKSQNTLQENELLFLLNMAEVLESKIQ